MSQQQPGIDADLGQWFEQHEAEVVRSLKRYFTGTEARAFSGGRFECLAAIADPNRFEATDFLAVEALSVKVPTESVFQIIVERPRYFSAMLKDIPNENIWEVKRTELDDGEPAAQVFRRLMELDGVGSVTAGKLLAAKRPRLIPILDSFVKEELRPPRDRFWLSMYDQLIDKNRRQLIERICKSAPDAVSLLRRIDVAVWMHVRNRKRMEE